MWYVIGLECQKGVFRYSDGRLAQTALAAFRLRQMDFLNIPEQL